MIFTIAMTPPTTDQLTDALMAEGIGSLTAARLAKELPAVCQRQLAYLDYQDDLEDRAATLLSSIEGDWPEPARSYWANATRQLEEEELAEEPAVETDESDEVGNLLAALERIAVMSHGHRAGDEKECPVCVAWEALRVWGHGQAVGKTNGA